MPNSIVVVEDDSSIREMLRYYFQSTGYEVRAYESGEDFFAAEESLSGRLGRKVTITTGRKKGRLELEFYNMDDLNALLDLLNTLTPKRREGGTPNG